MTRSTRPARALALLGTLTRLTALSGSLVACNALLDNQDRDGLDYIDLPRRADAGSPPPSPASDAGTDADGASCVGAPQSDPQNCGRCGHDCLGGACAAGVCQPFVFARATRPQQVFVVAGDVYFSDGETAGGGINWCAKGACEAPSRTAFATSSYGLAVDGSGIAAADRGSGAVHEFPLRFVAGATGVPCTTVTAPVGTALDATHLFFTTLDGNVHRCIRGSQGSMIVGQGAANGGAVAVDATRVYWASDGATSCAGGNGCLQGVLKTASSAATAGVSLGRRPRTLFVSGTRLFWTASGGAYGGEASWRENGLGGSESSYERQLGDPWGITADAADVYFTTTDGKVRRALRTAPMGQSVILATGQNDPRGIAVDTDAVYWTSFGGNAVMKLAK